MYEIDENLMKYVRESRTDGRNSSHVEAEIRELEKELKLPSSMEPMESMDDDDEKLDFW